MFDRLCRNVFEPEPQFGRFRLISELGRGGMGVVWRAHDSLLDREVALKILPPTTAPQERERMLREARAPSRVPHPGIVKVHEMGEVEGRPFIVMDLVEGAPLSHHRSAPVKRRVEICAEIAAILAAAHAQGVVHRDLKPSNILITKEGRPVIVDFGLSRTMGRDERVTGSGAIFGTPIYMSPEQADGTPGEIDAQSDLYSFGVVMYEFLSGSLPYHGDTPYAILEAILHAEPPRIPDLPRELEAIVFKAIAKKKADRYASAGRLAADFRTWLQGERVDVTRVRRRRKLWPWAAGVVVAVAAIVGMTRRNPKPAPEPPRSEVGHLLSTSRHVRLFHRPYHIEVETLPEDPRFAQVRAGLSGEFAEEFDDLIAGRPRPEPPLTSPERRLVAGLALYNARAGDRFDYAALFAEFPTPRMGAIVALARLCYSGPREALATLDAAAKLPNADLDADLDYLRALCFLELERYDECETELGEVEDPRLLEYTRGLVALERGRKAEAAERFRAAPKSWMAEYHLACATGDVEHMKIAIKGAWSAGEYRKTAPATRFKRIHRAHPFFQFATDRALEDPYLQPLRGELTKLFGG